MNDVDEMCEADITSCVPNHVAKYLGVKPKLAGPNCWNLALVMKGLLPALRYSPPDEMSFYMSSPLCRELSAREKPKAGDIGAIRQARPKEELHGFIYISEDLSYSKNGKINQQPFDIMPTEEVIQGYGGSKIGNCRSSSASADCQKTLSYFRCESMGEFLKSHPELPAHLVAALNSTSKFETCLQNVLLKGDGLSQIRTLARSVSSGLAVYLEKQKTSAPTAAEEFVIGALALRLRAINDRLNNLSGSASPGLTQLAAQAAR